MRTPILVTVLALAGCTSGSGTLGQETRDVASFDAIDVGGPFRVTVQVGPPAKVEILGDDNVVPKVEATVRDSTLRLSLPGRVVTKLPLEAVITLPALVDLEASGAATVTVGGLAGERLEVDASGASQVSLAGTVDALDLEVSGASTLDGQALTAAKASVDASGASTVNVHATTSLHAEASGASTIRYHGTPAELAQDANGASTIEAAGESAGEAAGAR